MYKKQETTASLTIVGIALFATITMISPTQALALGPSNADEDFTLNRAEDGMDSSGTSDNTDEEEDSGDSTIADIEESSSSGYEEFQKCLDDIEQSPTEEQVQDCIESSYGGQDSSKDDPSGSADEDDTQY